MSDSVLNNSWPSFSKLWMKRWSFKRASECKPCSGFSAIPDSRSVTPDADANSSSLAAGDHYNISEEKDDISVDMDDCSSEDLPSLESSLHGSEYYKDLVMMEPADSISPPQRTPKPADAAFCVAGETNISFDKGEVIITYTKPFLCPVAFGRVEDTGITQSGSPVEKDNEAPEDEDLVKEQGPIPILVRSLSTSRRHSWDEAASPTDTVCRFSLGTSEMEIDLEMDIKSPTSTTSSETLTIHGPQMTKTNLLIEADHGNLSLQEVYTGSKDGDSASKRLRSKSVPSTLDKIATPRISRSLESSCPVIEVIEPFQLETIEKDHVEPNHVLFVQQVLQELKQYHGTKHKQEGSREPKQDLTWFEFLSNETEEAAKPEKVEKGTKVKRRLSSLKNRVTGSWQKDKGKMKEQLKRAEIQRTCG